MTIDEARQLILRDPDRAARTRVVIAIRSSSGSIACVATTVLEARYLTASEIIGISEVLMSGGPQQRDTPAPVPTPPAPHHDR
ncbi:hypothetical protein EPN42_04640 [bacterium]|nr:MAG: hypothetical protein EPN42_04640 [bacterium]